jgi:hypothetical protein
VPGGATLTAGRGHLHLHLSAEAVTR